ncbi:MAG: response regulator [Proteobacteria bacterium]|nr:response regulator [Pseudomonadota bacterium]MBU1736602.1 response regulator [Pseudomonadota bacterium]
MQDDIVLDDVFGDLEDGNEKYDSFLLQIRELLPGAIFQLMGNDGSYHPADEPPFSFLPDDIKKALASDAATGGVTRKTVSGRSVYALPVSSLNALLLTEFPESDVQIEMAPFLTAMLKNSVDLAQVRLEQKESVIGQEQLRRQIEVMKSQHSKLIGDNYRQYEVIQEKEQEYARNLEKDIAERTAELRETNLQLMNASKMKSEFLANMSHELRTPMNAIIGFSGLLQETNLDATQKDYAKTVKNSAESLLALINDILDLSKIEAGKMELEVIPYNMAELIESVSGMFVLPAKAKGVEVTTEVGSDLPLFYLGDRNRLRQVMINLVGNALKFTEKGKIEIRIERLKNGRMGPRVKFSVSDTGIGIPPERQKAIFEKFVQADGTTTRKYGGTGLGLSICTELVGLMGGAIEIESTPGEGSCFYFALNMIKDEEGPGRAALAAEKESRKATAEAGAEPGRVLLVEDNPVNQKLALILIKKQGCVVDVAGDGVAALDKVKNGVYDLILMDIQMPNMDGLTATRKIREIESLGQRDEYECLAGRQDPVPIVGLTAHARAEDRQKCLDAGMNDVLTKPIIRDILAKVVEKYAKRNS